LALIRLWTPIDAASDTGEVFSAVVTGPPTLDLTSPPICVVVSQLKYIAIAETALRCLHFEYVPQQAEGSRRAIASQRHPLSVGLPYFEPVALPGTGLFASG